MKDRKHPSSEGPTPSEEKFFDWKKESEDYRTPGSDKAEKQLRDHGKKTTDTARIERAFAAIAKDERHASWRAAVKNKIVEFEKHCKDNVSVVNLVVLGILRPLQEKLEQGTLETVELRKAIQQLRGIEGTTGNAVSPDTHHLLSSLRMELEKASM